MARRRRSAAPRSVIRDDSSIPMKLTDTFVVGETVVEVALVDIVDADVEVIVNSVCDEFHVGSGVSGAVLNAAGSKAYEEGVRDLGNRSLRAGDVAVSSGGKSRFKLILHALSSRCTRGTTPAILKDCVNRALEIASERGARSIGFPALGTGQMGFDVKEAARILIETVVDYCVELNAPRRVVFCLLEANAFMAFFREAVRQTVKQEYEGRQLGPAETENENSGAGGEELIARLTRCPPGKAGWRKFEEISAEIFSFLFVPPLSEPRMQARNKDGTSIRDAIFPNYADSGFWSVLDRRHQGRFIVLESKNYREPIGQAPVNQMSRYLRGKALGKVGFIASRFDVKPEAVAVQEEVFRDLDQLVLFVSDFDFAQMVALKHISDDPESYLQRMVDDFSLKY